MRRSAAPSFRKFKSPVITTKNDLIADNKTETCPSNHKNSEIRNTASILQLLNKKVDYVENETIDKLKCTEEKLHKKHETEKEVSHLYENKIFNIVWGKKSTKKHKTWEGDGTLILNKKEVTVKDEEGKVIGRLTNIKPECIEEGYIFSVGGKEVQIIELVQSENRKRPSSSIAEDQPLSKKVYKRMFSKKNEYYDSFLLPQPPLEHQWLHNVNKLPVTDVSVDKSLVRILREHQKQGVTFLYECVLGYKLPDMYGAILADEMGLGKTLQCIVLIWTLLKQGPYGGMPIVKNVLIVVPSSLLGNWNNEISKWLHGKYITVFTVDSKHKIDDYRSNIPILLLSYDMFLRNIQKICEKSFDLLICDEGHKLKNDNTKLASSLNQLEVKRRILLTGTPIQNDLREFYTLVNLVNPGLLGSAVEFKKQYMEPITLSRESAANEECKDRGEWAAAELNRKTSSCILRRTQQILEKILPAKTELVVFCKMTDIQKQLYRDVVCDWENRDGNEISVLSVITALKKICNHPSLLDLQTHDQQKGGMILSPVEKPCRVEDSVKMIILNELLQKLQSTEKIVIVSSYTRTLDVIGSVCKKRAMKYLRLDGSTPSAVRTSLVRKFNTDRSADSRVLLLSTKAGGVGLNLVAATRLVLFDSEWNPATDLQAMARIWRDGQTKSVYIYRLLTTGSIEEKIYQRQMSKLNISGAVVDLDKNISVKFSEEELKDILSLEHLERDLCVTHESLHCACDGDGQIYAPVQDSETRSCQLGQTRARGQPLPWEHHASPFEPHMLQECKLMDSQNHITYIFRNKCNI